jgi:HemY protein
VPAPAPAAEPAPKAEAATEAKTEPKAAAATEAATATAPADARLKPVIFPVAHAPDDPGPDEAPPVEDKKGKFRLFG